MPIIKRIEYLDQITSLFKTSKIVVLVGPNQVGKSSLAKTYAKVNSKKFINIHFFDLEDPTDVTLLENAKLAIGSLEGLIIIDELQRLPGLFPYIRVKADTLQKNSRILLLGSA